MTMTWDVRAPWPRPAGLVPRSPGSGTGMSLMSRLEQATGREPDQERGRGQWLILAVVLVGSFMAVLSWACLGGAGIAAAVLAAWEVRLSRRGGEPVIQFQLLRRRSFALGQLLALLYFAGFTSLFFTLSILWQQGLGRSALATGLLVVPFALASLLSAANSDQFSTRFGRKVIVSGICAMLAGQACVLLALRPVPGGRAPGCWPGRWCWRGWGTGW